MKADIVESAQPAENGVTATPEHEEVLQARATLTRYGLPVLLAIVVAALVFGGAQAYRTWRVNRATRASEALTRANSFNELEAVVADFPGTSSAPLALLRLARAYYDQGNYDLALTKYDLFIAKHGKHPLAGAATLGRLHAREAQGHADEALAGFAAFAAQHPTDYLTPQAIFGQIRCLERLERVAEAKALCEDFIAAQDEDSDWLPRAEETLQGLRRKAKAAPASADSAALPAPDRPTAAALPAASTAGADTAPDTAMAAPEPAP